MKNIVLVQPRIGDMDLFRDKPTPPTGLLAAASLLAPEFEIRIIDQRIDGGWRSTLSSALDSETVFAGITAMTGKMIFNGLEAAGSIRKFRESIPIVWGGIHPSLLPAQTAENELVDFVVEGEGEETFYRLVKDPGAKENIEGLWFREKKGVIRGKRREKLLDMNSLPPIPYRFVNMENYIQNYRGKRMFFYQSSRGCPCSCAYCYNRVFNKGLLRELPVERVVSEISSLRKAYDFSLVYFLDDNFFINKKRALKILAALRAKGLGAVLQGIDIESIARLSDEELDFLEEAGVERIAIGIESGSDRVRTEILRKAGSMDLVKKQISRLARRKMIVLCSFILGLPGETTEEIEKTVDLAVEILKSGDNFRIPQFYIFSPYPGTALFEQVRRAGYPFPRTLSGWGDYEWDYSNVQEKGMGDYLERAVFVSKFLDGKMRDYGSGRIFRILYALYRPFALMRMERRFLKPLPEKTLYDFLKGALSR